MDKFEGDKNRVASLHKYVFADSNPVSFKDPTGYFTSVELLAGQKAHTTLSGSAAVRVSTIALKVALIVGVGVATGAEAAARASATTGISPGWKRDMVERVMRESPEDNAFAVIRRRSERNCRVFQSSISKWHEVPIIDFEAQMLGQPFRVHVGPRGTPYWKEFKDQNRAEAIAAGGLQQNSIHDIHEYPYAVMIEGGATAHTDYATIKNNRSHGQAVGQFLRDHNLRLFDCVDVIVTQ